MSVPWVNYSTWQHILCSKVGAENIKKIRHDHLCKTSQWPFIFDSSQLYLVSHKKVWLTVCRSPPVIPTDTCALSYLSTVEEHIKRRLKLKLKTRWSNVWLSLQMIISIRKYKTKTKTKKITIIEMYQTVVSCGVFFPPVFCRCHKWCNVHNHIISSDPFIIMCNQDRIHTLSVVQCHSPKPKDQRERGGGVSNNMFVWWSKLITLWMSHTACVIPFWSHGEGHCCIVHTWIQMYGFLQSFL